MGIFGRKRAGKKAKGGRHALPKNRPAEPAEEIEDHPPDKHEEITLEHGPYDETEAPEDTVPRIDLGSVRVPVPQGAQVQVEMDQSSGKVRAVHVVTSHGQVTISAYAAPRTAALWPEVSEELGNQLRSEGATVVRSAGEWGPELSVQMGNNALYFVGVDGPRWMLRGVIAGPEQLAERAPDTLRSLMRDTIVARGEGPMPVRNPLPVKLPEAVAEHIAQRRGQQNQSG